MVMNEKDEDLALFMELRRREKEKNSNNNANLFRNSADADPSFGSKVVSNFSMFKTAGRRAIDEFLNSENDKSDYDWLLTPPGTPLYPSMEMESQRTVMSQTGNANAYPSSIRSKLENHQIEPTSRITVSVRQPLVPSGLNSFNAPIRRPSTSGGRGSTASRPATPTGRPTLTASEMAKTLRPSTPTSRATLPSTKPAAPPTRSSTPTRSMARPSTPTSRPSATASTKSSSRPATPTRRPSTPSRTPSISAPPVRSESVTRSGPVTTKNPVPSHGISPTVKSRPWKPSEIPGFSLETPPNLRTTIPERPASASRGRPGAPTSRSSSVEPCPNGRSRRQSCSPTRGRAPISTSGSSAHPTSRGRSNGNENVSPVLIGTKMVDRVTNMRKLAPPKQDDHHSMINSSSGKSSSLDGSGFGRTLSKKSFDMAMRHMDIRRSMTGNLRPLMTNIPASSMYSVRSAPAKSRTVSVSDSPLATSSTASSEPSVNNHSGGIDGSEVEDDDFGSEKHHFSPASVYGK
ncbi:hypothetical protein RJ641_028492 [Dillenia turbinata]|uniref:Uncharacterized protein n=1 Tax=Dillenia turbinata TaxID=194707 RepID=A0AAN8VZB6_9MAGN